MNALAARVERSASGAVRAALLGGRWHFQHGPIDLIIECWGEAEERALAYEQAWARFVSVLPELAAELPILRSPVCPSPPPRSEGLGGGEGKSACPLAGVVARRMRFACAPLAEVFITPMAAVAGAVADEILAAMTTGRRLRKAYVNNGGDIALHLELGERFETGIVGDLSKPKLTATATIRHDDPVRGIATSGWRGRSFSLGIADSVTVLARDAAAADAAATLVANAVNIDHPNVARRAARDLDPDSDLKDHPVTVAVGALDASSIRLALGRGEGVARAYCEAGHIVAAFLELQRRRIAVDARDPRAGRLAETRMAWSLHP